MPGFVSFRSRQQERERLLMLAKKHTKKLEADEKAELALKKKEKLMGKQDVSNSVELQPATPQSSLQIDVSDAKSESSQIEYQSLSDGSGTPVGCCAKFQEDFAEGMAPSKNAWKWSNNYWNRGFSDDNEPPPPNRKGVDFLFCKLPIMAFGLFNGCYAAGRAALKSCESQKAEAESLSPQREVMSP
jgi:hypothetical protein